MESLKTPNQIIDALGGTTKTAGIFGVKPSAVSNWRKKGFSQAIRFDVAQECAARNLSVDPEAYRQTEHSA